MKLQSSARRGDTAQHDATNIYTDTAPDDEVATDRQVKDPSSPSTDYNNDRCFDALLVSDATIFTRVTALWTRLISTCIALSLHGYERTAIAAALPHFHTHVLKQHCVYLYERCVKRTSLSWQQDEPSEVVALCQSVVQCFDDIVSIATGRRVEDILHSHPHAPK